MQTYESSAVYQALGKPGESPDRGGCINLLTPNRSQTSGSSSMGPNACLIEVERWRPNAKITPTIPHIPRQTAAA
jgi:trimethylamine-N-oxide reductase (cytochrome c)